MITALDEAYWAAKSWLEGLDDRPVGATATISDLRRDFGGALPERGKAAEVVIRDLAEKAASGLLGSTGGRFFAWVIGGGLDAALAADWLVSAWDQNAALFACSPASAVIEQTAGEWLKELLDLPREASFAFTTGCQLAHMTGLAAARHALLKRTGWDVEENGLCGAAQIRVLASEQRHGSVERAVRYLGFGRKAIKPLETDANGRITPAVLRDAVAREEGPLLLVLNAADLNIGAFDPFQELIPIAHEVGGLGAC